MTQYTATPLAFSSAKRRTLQADFSGGVLTSDAGVLFLREADRRLGLLDALDHAVPDPRDPDLIAHPQRCLLAQRIFGIACSYEDLNDHQRLRDDPLWQTAVDHPGPDDAPQLASPPTLCRLEDRVRRADLVKMATALVEYFIASQATPPEELVLDFDATDDPVHGQQENRFFHGYYDGYCFLPLYVTCGDHLLVAYLRPSNIDAALHSRAILKLLVQRLRQAWPEVRIVVRADSGFCRWRLMRWCDRHGVDYLLGLAKNAVLQRQAAAWQEQAEQAFRADADGQAHRVFGEFRYAAGSWDRQRRVIAKADNAGGQSQSAFHRHQSDRRPPDALRGSVLPTRRHGEPHQGAAAGIVRGSDELSSLRGEPVPSAVGGGGLRAGVAHPSGGVGGDGVGSGGGRDDPAAAVQGRGVGAAERASGGGADGEQLPVAGVVRRGGRSPGRAGVGRGGRAVTVGQPEAAPP